MGTCSFFRSIENSWKTLVKKNLCISEILYCRETYKEREKIFANISRYFSAVKKKQGKKYTMFYLLISGSMAIPRNQDIVPFFKLIRFMKTQSKKMKKKQCLILFFSFQRHFGSMENTLQVNLGENFENPQYRVDIFQLFTFYHLDSRTTFNSTFNVKVSMC